MKSEDMDEFEKELHQALQRRPAPPSLKRKVMERRGRQSAELRHRHLVVWERLAAGLVLAAVLGGAAEWQVRRVEDNRKGQEARRQVLTALRITGHALNEVNVRLATQHHDGEE